MKISYMIRACREDALQVCESSDKIRPTIEVHCPIVNDGMGPIGCYCGPNMCLALSCLEGSSS